MDVASRRMKEAIARIDAFVAGTTDGSLTITPEKFRELSCSIQLAKSARHARLSLPFDQSFSDLSASYRCSLEKLQNHLQHIETSLSAERARLLAEHSRLARTREWQEQVSRTQ
jgi:hypothetical protein